MFDVKNSEKQIAMNILKREIGIKDMGILQTATQLKITPEMLKKVFRDNGEFYTFQTLIFWAEVIALSSSPDEVLDRKLERKAGNPPQDQFYNAIWHFMTNRDVEQNKNQDFGNSQIKD
jgi:hypothetical protein